MCERVCYVSVRGMACEMCVSVRGCGVSVRGCGVSDVRYMSCVSVELLYPMCTLRFTTHKWYSFLSGSS